MVMINSATHCVVCLNKIRVMCCKGTGVCSQKCQKKRGERQFAMAA